VGVGFGRLVPALTPFGCEIWGIDLSREMIEAARERFGSQCADLQVGTAEALPYRDGSFDRVICWGTFDVLRQEIALVEMTRVLRLEGRLLLSGKNDDYHDDDEEAFTAELIARAKGFPNRFTTFPALEALFPSLGLRLTEVHYFVRRGDLSLDHGSVVRPARFYEYVLLAEKEETARASFAAAGAISETVSQTFRRRTRFRTSPR
jgi:SAM-dependent methyltransferase